MNQLYPSFEQALQANSIPLPNKPFTHNKFTRWGKNNRYSAKLIGDGGYFHDYNMSETFTWFPDIETPLTDEQIQVRKYLINTTKMAEVEDRLRLQEKAAENAAQIILDSKPTGDSVYLTTKKVQSHGIYFSHHKGMSCLIIPATDIDGKVHTVQRIYNDGSKYFLAGGVKTGCFHVIGDITHDEPLIFCEGYSTGASIFESTGCATIICFDAGNIEQVARAFRERNPNAKFIIAGDNDAFKKKNTGKIAAKKVAEKYGGTVVIPEFSESSLKHKPTDFNDLMIHEGIEVVKHQLTKVRQTKRLKAMSIEAFLGLEIPTREMLMSPIIPKQGLVMLHAARGTGKTFTSLSIAVTIANGGQMFGNKWRCPKPRKVLLIDGEMPASVLQERLKNLVESLDTCINSSNLKIITPDIQDVGMPDLSTREGQMIIEEHLEEVDLIIIDNLSALCRTGKENDAESWLPIQEWFLSLRRRGISVLIVHHSNKNSMQRGTSKKEDLLDTVIALKHPSDYERSEGARFEVHYEKARGFCGEEAKPFEVQLLREEGRVAWKVSEIEDSRRKEVMDLSSKGMKQREIAKEMKISPATVNRILKEAKRERIEDGS